MAYLLFRATYSYRVYKYFLQLTFCNPSVYPNLLLNPNTLYPLKIFFLWCEATFYRKYLAPSNVLSFLDWWWILCFILPWSRHISGQECHSLSVERKPHHSHKLIEHLKINTVWLFTWDFLQMVKEKGSEANELKEMKETEREISKLTLIYNAHCFDKFFI